jgi:hypothetical protein
MWKWVNISLYMRRPLVIYVFATAPALNFLIYEENLIFFFISAMSPFHDNMGTSLCHLCKLNIVSVSIKVLKYSLRNFLYVLLHLCKNDTSPLCLITDFLQLNVNLFRGHNIKRHG